MKRVVIAMAGVVLLGATWVGVSAATGAVVAQAPNARLALLVDGGDTPGTFVVLRKKGVASVTNPLTGFYCITPSSSTMKLGKVVPIVALEASGTPNSDTTVAWSSL